MRAAFWVLLATILGSSLVFIDATIVGIALPVMQRDLHATASQAQWIVEAYTLVLGALMLLGGAVADRYGRKRIFIIGIIVFLAGSVWCALASTIEHAILARVLQGIGGMLMAPASLAIIGGCFEGAERDKAVGTWSAFTAVTTLISPVLGGTLVSALGWRSVFFLNVPLGIFTAYAAFRHVPETRDEDATGLPDIAGSALMALGLGGLVYALIAASGGGASRTAILSTGIVGAVLIVLFIFEERRSRDPIIPLELFASPIFSGVNIATLLLYGALSAVFYFLPFDLIQAHGYSPAAVGGAMLPFVVLVSALSRASTGVVSRIGPRWPLTVGAAVVTGAFLAFALIPRDAGYWRAVFPPMLLSGLGMGFLVAPLTTTVMNSVPIKHVGVASGINNALARIGGLLAIAVAGMLVWTAFNVRLDSRLTTLHLSNQQRAIVDRQRPRLAAGSYGDPRVRAAVIRAYDRAFDDVALLCAGLAAVASATAYFMLGSASRKRVSPRTSRSGL